MLEGLKNLCFSHDPHPSLFCHVMAIQANHNLLECHLLMVKEVLVYRFYQVHLAETSLAQHVQEGEVLK